MADDLPMTDAGSGQEDEPVLSLAKGRVRRSTAGGRMTALIDAEADDELALLFAEQEDDEEFIGASEEGNEEEGEGGEEADDMIIDSSSDDEDDQGPNAQEDELEGERELQRQAKAERLAKKRKEQEGGIKFPALRKRVKIDPSAAGRGPAIPTPRPKKKSERISWLPTPEDGPTRSSSRKQTVQNKEMTHARLKDSEERRVRLIATMEEAARRKQKLKPKVMTQADRLAEAAKTERLNSKSLNRWEEMERKRTEEQQARLAALQNRRLEGAVMTWWSGFAKWINGKLAQVGMKEISQPAEGERRRKGNDGDDSSKRGKAKKGEKGEKGEKGGDKSSGAGQSLESHSGKKGDGQAQETKKDDQTQQNTFPSQAPANFLDGIHLFASMKDDSSMSSAAPQGQPAEAPVSQASAPPKPSTSQQPQQKPRFQAPPVEGIPATTTTAQVLPVPASKELKSTPQLSQTADEEPQERSLRIEVGIMRSEGSPATGSPSSQQPPNGKPETQAAPLQVKENRNSDDSDNAQLQQTQIQPTPTTPSPFIQQPPPEQKQRLAQHQEKEQGEQEQNQQPIPTPPPAIEYSSRNLIILENFENKSPQEREEYNIFFNSRKPQKLQKIPQELCPITSRPARYRDPETNLPYANAAAYREIRQTLANRYAWSGLLGCFVGPVGVGARGVPERFLAPNAPPPPPPSLLEGSKGV
ncbi:hypothetical protein ACO22_06306 [Paracoccidioides brasiliensis]|uniref:Vps72/YL1 C-terminal domain-containing protein n=1 Tax=Paracoccidioides brasiliensis TaxID=121759 RepID=A0A1D2J7Y5_PARBR|nr:hypothetical protein ACO22_06306 [Paracoccidioides brasiliensis]